MYNYKLTIAYDGTQYAGWQRQTSFTSHVLRPTLKTIQEIIETALQKIFHAKICLIGCGRTDSGVHAIGFIANFKAVKSIPAKNLKTALNGSLPRDICVRKAESAPLNFHARFDAVSKVYRYLVSNSRTKTVFGSHPSVCWVRYPLDIALMRRQARVLLGRHDFKSFQASDRTERNSVTTIKRIVIAKKKVIGVYPFLKGEDLIVIDIEGTGFLRNMVRNIAGTLIDIGRGKMGELVRILEKKDRRAAGHCAPACGLYLMKVKY